jgi:2-oxoglutarate ferredoxin oxidoreductase subunit beta
METPVQPFGVISGPINPVAFAISLNVGFVARAFSGDVEGTKAIMKRAILHRGFALVDIFQPCISFNKTNTFAWFKKNTYALEDGYKPNDRAAAFARALEEEPFPLGVLYESDERPPFEERLAVYREDKTALRDRKRDMGELRALIAAKR